MTHSRVFIRTSIVASPYLRALFTLLLSILFFTPALAAQGEIPGPPNSGTFGLQVVVLPNGNIVVSDPGFDENGVTNIGAVYLLDGATHAIISTLKGSTANDQIGGQITVLANGNYVVQSVSWSKGLAKAAGAVTFCKATTGCDGVVSFGNSLIGSTEFDLIGQVMPLPNGNYIVRSLDWDTYFPPIRKNVGSVTFCNGTIGCKGEITTLNTLIGASEEDKISRGGITILKDGDYVVSSPQWNNSFLTDAGAVTFCRGTSGCGGVVSPSNSLIGDNRDDRVGSIPSANFSVVELANGNYVVASGFYNRDTITSPIPFGAATLCNGVTGCIGPIWSNISLIGTDNGHLVAGNGVTALPNGNFVVSSPWWDGGRGAVTFCSGVTGCGGDISPANSLLGSKQFDYVGGTPTSMTQLINPITVLSNGNYVVVSPHWDNGLIVDAGAVTLCSATTGCNGPVGPHNSLVGTTANDQVGRDSTGFKPGVYALKNGNYVVNTPAWDNPSLGTSNVGAVTFCHGVTNSCANTAVSQANSLTGSNADDLVGDNGTIALSNGNYAVTSRFWDNGSVPDVGAVTFCNQLAGCSGSISPTNSLVGAKTNDFSFDAFAIAFPNGSYVVAAPSWDNGAATDAGAVTFCNSTTGCSGTIGPSNSLVGSSASDKVGSNYIRVLSNGNYIVNSPTWAANAGAVTFCNGITGCSGVVSASNSLVGSTASDRVGQSIEELPNGNYVVRADSWDNGATANAGAVTYGNGTSGTVGPISSNNSVVGTVASPFSSFLPYSYDAVRNRLFVGRSASNVVNFLFFETTALTDGNLTDETTWSNGVPGALTNVIIPAGRTVTVDAPTTVGGLSIANGANLVMNADLNLTGSLELGTHLNTESHKISLSCTSGAMGQPANYVIGNLEKKFCKTGEFSYPTGTASGYSPLVVTVSALGEIPSSLTIKTNQGNRAGMDSSQSVRRYWTLTETGDLTTNLSFNYLDGDVAGDESTYQLYKWEDMTETLIPSVLDTNMNTISAEGISDFSDWTIGTPGSSPPDGDGDGVADDADNCPATANPDQTDADGDGLGNVCDLDDDNDGVSDEEEAAAGSDPLNANSTPEVCDGQDNDLNDGVDEGFTNTDGDGQANCVDTDDDNDGQSDADELSCGSDPLNAGSKATDTDGDNHPDCVDPDDDNDGVPDATDNCPLVANANQADTDGDQIGDACDPTPNGDVEVVFSSNRDGNFEIYGMRADGSGVVRLTNNGADDLDPALSPDRSKIIFTSTRDGNLEIYSMNVDGTGLTRLTNNSKTDANPAWSPNGSKVAFASDRDGNLEIYSMNADGTGPVRLTSHNKTDGFPAWSPDGSRIAFVSERFGNLEIYLMNADGTGLVRLTNHNGEDVFPTWSPDGSKIAFSSTRNGNFEIYSMNADGTGATRLTTNSAFDGEPAWGANGKLVFSSTRNGNFEIYSMNADSTGVTRLSNNSALDSSPHW